MPDTTTRPWLCPQVDCPAGNHDTVTAYRQGCRSAAAREDRRLYAKRWRQGRHVDRKCHDYIGIARRIEAAAYMGWSQRAMEQETGFSARTLWMLTTGRQKYVTTRSRDRLIPVLERLALTPRDDSRVRGWARRQGFRPLLAWDDIDDPAEQAPPAPDLADQIAELAGRGLNQLQVARKLDLGEKTVRNRWPQVTVSVDVNIIDAVRTGRRHLSDCSDPEAETVVASVFRDYRDEGWERPGVKTAELLDVDYAVVQLIRQRLAKRHRPVKESP
jgi:hypothetical protein